MGYDLGVDLGTTFVAAAVARGGRPEMFTLGNRSVVTPAAVYLNENSELLFGEAADRQTISHPDRVEREFKRRLGDPTPVVLSGSPYQVTALMAAQLRDVLAKVTASEGAPPDRVALTHPANWGPYRRELFDEIPRLAGLSGYHTLTEPEAAAAYYNQARNIAQGDTIAVYDLGGGTFDATILRKRPGGIELLGEPEGIERLGGIDFDEAIFQWVQHRHGGDLADLDMTDPQALAAMTKLRQECVLAKEALSVDSETTIPVYLPAKHFFVRLGRPEFENMIRASVESTIGTLLRALSSADVEVAELSSVLLVGGSSRIPLIARMISQELGRPTVVDAHPKHAVALGAATVASTRPMPRPARPTRPAPASGVPLVDDAAGGSPDGPPPGAAPGGPPGVAPGSAPVPAPDPGPRPAARRGILIGAAAGAVLVVAGVVGGVLVFGGGGGDSNASGSPDLGGAAIVSSATPSSSVSPSVTSSPSGPAVSVAVPTVEKTIGLKYKPEFVAASPRGSQLYVADAVDKKVTVLDTATDVVTATIPITTGPPQFLSFSPDGRFVYVSIWDKPGGKIAAVSILDTSDNSVKATIPVSTRPFLGAVTADGKQLWVPNHDSGSISIIDIPKRKVIGTIKVAPNPHWLAFSKDGKLAYSANHESNLLSVIDTATHKVTATIKVGKSPHSLALNPDRPMLMNVNYDGNTVSVIDTRTNKVTKTVKVGKNPQNIAWAPDGRFAYAVNNVGNSLSVISADKQKVTATLAMGKSPTSIAVLPDGTRGYVTNLDGKSLTVVDLSFS